MSEEHGGNVVDGEEKPRRFLNGWSKEQERIISTWADISTCYRWLHDKAEKHFKKKALLINSSVIVLSSIGGFANIGVQSLFENNEQAIKYASFAIGGVSLFAGMLTTLNNLLKWSQLEESHRVASISWGKFARLSSVEMALDPDDRMDSLDFLKICRAELDRLIEQSPPIPDSIIREFNKKFGDITDLKKPEICGSLEHTTVYESSELHLKKLAEDAKLMLRENKDTLRELVTPEMEQRVEQQLEERMKAAIEERKVRLEEELAKKKKHEEEQEAIRLQLLEERKAQLLQEIALERKKVEDELEDKRRKAQQEEETMKALAEERKKRIEEELELERKKMYSGNFAEGTKSADRLVGSPFESRLNMNKSHRAKSVRRRSVIDHTMVKIETEPEGSTGIIEINKGAKSARGAEEPKNDIIIVSKE